MLGLGVDMVGCPECGVLIAYRAAGINLEPRLGPRPCYWRRPVCWTAAGCPREGEEGVVKLCAI